MDFEIIVEAIRQGYATLPPLVDDPEKEHEKAVGLGLALTGNLHSIWASNRVFTGYDDIYSEVLKKGKYGFDIDLEVLKQYDLAILDYETNRLREILDTKRKIRRHDNPSWAFQLKGRCHENYAVALGFADLLFALIDKEHAKRNLNQDIEMVMVWAEHTSSDSNNILRMNADHGTFEYVLEPTALSKLDERDGDYSWADPVNRRIKPTSLSFLKRGLAGQTGTSFYHQFRKKGVLTIKTEYQQILVNGWHVYIHRIIGYGLVGGETLSGHPITDLLEWVP